jgi:pimeloyl-ACP methyl ester carboxylesterase
MFARIRWSVLVILLSSVLLMSTGCGDSSDSPVVPRFESTACRHTLEIDSTTRCGYLIVPEDRSASGNTDTLKLYVTLFESVSGDLGNPPMIYLTGGPGAATASANAIFESTDSSNTFRWSFGGDRDLIVLDQRGTNYSSPALYCSEELGPLRSQVYGISYADAAALRIAAFGACYDRLLAQGIDPSAYDSLENAADVNDLMKVLGYTQYNLYSASYGTRLAMQVMKHYPERLHSVVLDSILPPEINPYEAETTGILYAFKTFFKAAAADYPNLETQFYTLMDALAATPVDVIGHHYANGAPTDDITVHVTGVQLAGYLVAELKDTPYDPDLPLKISAMYASGDYTALADNWISFLDFFFPAAEGGSDAPSVGMYNSVFGADDAYYTTPERIRQIIAANVANPSLAAYLEGAFIETEPAVQGLWPVAPTSFQEREPVVSDIPTLMLVGTLDTATPEIFSEPSAEYLSHSFFFPILAGHATAYLPCVDQMIDDFVSDPLTSPTNGCATDYDWN